jgi:hypothetical protein
MPKVRFLNNALRASALIAALAATTPAFAGDLGIKVQVPRIDVAEYHRPYIAIWVEGADQSIASNLAVWYQTDPKKEDGTQWLKDLRQWWRRGGRELTMPVDGVTGATRPVGEHQVTFKGNSKQLAALAPGKYSLVVEAVREVGGRELLKIPFEWPVKQKQQATAQGKAELGAVTLDLIP